LESDAAGGDGWSRVAAKKVAPRMLVSGSAFVGTNSFAALGGGGATGVGSGPGKVTFAKKKLVKATKAPPAPVVVDDWEAAEAAEEERERPSGASGDADPVSDASAAIESAPADQSGPADVAVVEAEDTLTNDPHADGTASAGPQTAQKVKDGGIGSSAAAATPEAVAPSTSLDVANPDGDIDEDEGDEDPSTSHGVRLDA
jgi:hypothetical protein